ncbi:MAG: 3-keto-disaccharide hydrolase [Janthinobacterium lividum]
MPRYCLANSALLAAALALCTPLQAAEAGWTPLFNGRDLSGWTTWISMQPTAPNMKVPTSSRGLNQDPRKVFSVVDGMLRVSGEEWGAVSTVGEYEHFHLKLEFKWGSKKWAPRLDLPRDSGLLYYAVGPEGAESGHWMRSHEAQIQEGDTGDYHSLDGVTVDAHVGDANEGDWKFYRYEPSLPLRTGLSARILKKGNFEKPTGEWNTMEVIADGKTLVHIVNGHEVLRAENPRQNLGGRMLPHMRGKFSLQSEGAEVFYRNIQVRPLAAAKR